MAYYKVYKRSKHRCSKRTLSLRKIHVLFFHFPNYIFNVYCSVLCTETYKAFECHCLKCTLLQLYLFDLLLFPSSQLIDPKEFERWAESVEMTQGCMLCCCSRWLELVVWVVSTVLRPRPHCGDAIPTATPSATRVVSTISYTMYVYIPRSPSVICKSSSRFFTSTTSV